MKENVKAQPVFLSTREVGAWLKIPKNGVLKLVREGRLPVVKLGPKSFRFNQQQVAECLLYENQMGRT